jgi:single-stranded DNA-binding protein
MATIETAFFCTLGRDAESKISKSGKQYLRLACRVGDGDAAQWVNTTVFDATALDRADQLVKGARVYCEGSIKLDQWQAADGTTRHGLSCLSWHCRLAAIGRNKPPHGAVRERKPVAEPHGAATPANDFHDDAIPFAPEWR